MKKYPEGHFLGMYMGICMGAFTGMWVAISIATENLGLIGIGPAIGVGIGAIIGQSVEEKYKKEGRIRKLTKEEERRRKKFSWIGIIVGAILFITFLFVFFILR